MKHCDFAKITSILVLFLLSYTSYAANPQVTIQTNKGDIVLELYPDKAPKTVANFLSYVKSGHYKDTIFHRVIKDFMIQGGGFTQDMQQKPTQAPIKNEANNGLANERGTIAMARTGDPHSATAQFYINTGTDNGFLNFRGETMRGWGYCVFGRVVKGMKVVDEIESVQTQRFERFADVPVDTIVIKNVVLKEKAAKTAKKPQSSKQAAPAVKQITTKERSHDSAEH